MNKIQIIWFFVKNLAQLKLKDNVLIWIKGTPCIIPVQKAFAYKAATEKGISFNSAMDFEDWYDNRVINTDFPTFNPQPVKQTLYFDGNKPVPLYWE